MRDKNLTRELAVQAYDLGYSCSPEGVVYLGEAIIASTVTTKSSSRSYLAFKDLHNRWVYVHHLQAYQKYGSQYITSPAKARFKNRMFSDCSADNIVLGPDPKPAKKARPPRNVDKTKVSGRSLSKQQVIAVWLLGYRCKEDGTVFLKDLFGEKVITFDIFWNNTRPFKFFRDEDGRTVLVHQLQCYQKFGAIALRKDIMCCFKDKDTLNCHYDNVQVLTKSDWFKQRFSPEQRILMQQNAVKAIQHNAQVRKLLGTI